MTQSGVLYNLFCLCFSKYFCIISLCFACTNAERYSALRSELLVVVVVIAIVASITVISFNGIQERAQRSAALANLNNAYSKLKVWTIDHNAILPESLEAAGVEQPKNGEIVFWPYNNNTGICLSSRVGGVTVYQLWDEGVPAKDGACDEIDWVTGPPLARNSTLDSVVAFDDYDTAAPHTSLSLSVGTELVFN